MEYGKFSKGLTPLTRPKLSKKSQHKKDEIKKLYEANRYWNYYKFQLHWHKLEWLNPKSQIKREKHFSIS